MTTPFMIAIDGPAASGKTTIGKQLADALGYLFLDTGFMYRAVTLAALEQGVDVNDETAVTQLAKTITLEVVANSEDDEGGDGRLYTVLLAGKDVTWQLRTPPVDGNVSQVSKYAAVREALVARQREYGQQGAVVMVGRDIGTVVMPDAPLKLFVVASPEERARRRLSDRTKQGHQDSYNDTLADVKRRDQIDSSRTHSPLKPAADALLIDTTDQTPAQIVQAILQLVQERAN